MSVAGLILAAGRGTRFGEDPKLLARLGDKPLVRHVAEAAVASKAAPVLAVVGHRAGEVATALAGLAVRRVNNPDYMDGLSTSLRAGFAALPAEADGAVVLLGDMPLVSAALIDRLVEAWEAGGRPGAVVPVHAGRRGNPVLLSRSLQGDIKGLSGDTGAGPLLRGRADVLEVQTDDAAVTHDIDTREAWERIALAGRD